MITIKNTDFTSSLSLAAVLAVRTKEQMLDTCKKLDLYVSPNIRKDEMARRLAAEILDYPLAVLCSLGKNELQLVQEFVQAGPNQYIVRKMRKTPYKLQKFSLILTYEDFDKMEWHMLMPDCVRESLQPSLPALLALVEQIGKVPSYKDIRRMMFMHSLRNGEL